MDVTTFRVDLVRTVDESYPVVVGRRLDERIAQFLERHRDRRIAVVTDSTVESLAVPAPPARWRSTLRTSSRDRPGGPVTIPPS